MFFHPWPNPDILSIGPLAIRFYGIVYALGYLFIAKMLARHAEKIENLTKENAWDVVGWGLLGGLIGARIFHVIADFHLYQNNLMGVFAIWRGGLGFQGGLAGGLLGAYLYCKKYDIDFLRISDVVATYIPFVLGFGRIANFVNAEHLGPVSNGALCVVFPQENPAFSDVASAVCRHPTQLYQAASQFVMFGVMILLYKMRPGKGVLTGTFLVLYGGIRFMTDMFRADLASVVTLGGIGFTITQIVSMVIFFIGAAYLIRVRS